LFDSLAWGVAKSVGAPVPSPPEADPTLEILGRDGAGSATLSNADMITTAHGSSSGLSDVFSVFLGRYHARSPATSMARNPRQDPPSRGPCLGFVNSVLAVNGPSAPPSMSRRALHPGQIATKHGPSIEPFVSSTRLDQAAVGTIRRAVVRLVQQPRSFPLVEDQSEVLRGPDHFLRSADRIAGIPWDQASHRSSDQNSANQREHESTHENTLHPWIGVAASLGLRRLSSARSGGRTVLVNWFG